MSQKNLRRLSLLLPLVAMFSGAPTRGIGLELNASDIASIIADALQQGHLNVAQNAVDQLRSCNVHALRVDGVEVTLSQLTRIISALASGDAVDNLLQRPRSFATFVVDPTRQVVTSCSTEQSLPVGSSG